MEPLETSRDAILQENTDEVMTRSALVSPIEIDEITVGGIVESDLPTMTHAGGIAILDEYFPKSAINSRPLNGCSCA